MTGRKLFLIGGWLAFILLAAAIAARARYVADLSAFLPARPTPAQRLLVDQLRSGPASRLILIALERGDAAARAPELPSRHGGGACAPTANSRASTTARTRPRTAIGTSCSSTATS